MSNSVSPSNLTPSKPEIAAAAQANASKPNPVVNDSVEPMSREVRLGLVLYGGVSLAIYMNGVAHEFFNVVRGRGIYRLIKALTDSDVIVDIASGASAGGINGIFLGYALCNEKEFGDFAQLWRHQGDLSLLLRKPGGVPETYLSLFDSEHYYQNSLQDAFRAVHDIDRKTPEMPSGILDDPVTNGKGSDGERPHVKEFDLFIAGTNVGGNIFTDIDDAGHAITVKDHRSVFILSHRRGRKSPFDPKDHPDVTFESLAKLARTTSAFPAAFSPVEITGVPPDTVTVDGRLQRWGRVGGVKAYFVDGGVLYNKPFSYTIKDITYRMANTEVERLLLYVEPDPERFEEEWKEQQEGRAKAPSFFSDISDSLISLPGYQSIAGDLQDLADQNTKVRRYQILTETLQKRVWDDPAGERLKYIGKSTQPAGDSGLPSEVEDVSKPAQEVHHRSRLLGLGERVIQGALRAEVGRNMLLSPGQAEAAEKLTTDLFDRLKKEEDLLRTLDCFDVFYRLRRLFHAVDVIRKVLYRERSVAPGSDEGKRYLKLHYALNRQIELLQIIQTVMEEAVDRYPIIRWKEAKGPEQITDDVVDKAWLTVQQLLEALLDPAVPEYASFLSAYTSAWGKGWGEKPLQRLEAEWLPQATLTGVLESLRKVRYSLQPPNPLPPKAANSYASLLSLTDACEKAIFAQLPLTDNRVQVAYEYFNLIDSVLYPIELAGDLQCKDVIKIVRVSPVDAQRGFSRKDIDQKVAGVGFYHFAAFFKRSWRSNDIMWGRLDGICQLAECLLTRERLELLLGDANPGALQKIRRRFGMFDADGKFTGLIPKTDPGDPSKPFTLHPDAIFPNNSPSSREALTEWLQNLLSDTPTGAIAELQSQNPGRLELLIQMAQYEVIAETLPQVAEDAAEEQLEWNCYPVPESMRKKVEDKAKLTDNPLRFDLDKGTFMEGEGYLEPTEVTIAAAAAAKAGIEKIAGPKPPQGQTPKETPLGKFFAGTFGLKPADRFKSLPLSVLAAMFTQAALVLRNCVLTGLGATGQVIEKNSLFRYSVDWPLRALYRWAQWWRRNPASERFWRTLILCIAIALLAVGILARHPLIFNPGLSLPWFIGLIVLPVTALLVMLFFGTRDRWTLVALLVSLLLATAGLSAGLFIEIQQWLKTVSSGDHTLWSWLDASLFFLVAFAIAFFLGKHRGGTRPLPLRIATLSELTHGQVGRSYSDEVEAADGTPPYKWTIAGAALPTGLTLSPTGLITGTPRHARTSRFTLQVTDGRLKTARQEFKIKIIKAESADETGPRAPKTADAVAAGSR